MLHDIATALASLLLPPGWVFLLGGVGYAVMKVLRRKWQVPLLLLLSVLLWAGSTSALGNLLMGLHLRGIQALDVSAGMPASGAGKPQAIVVLGVGALSPGLEYRQATLMAESHERLRYALHLSAKTGLPVLFSGGETLAGPALKDGPLLTEAAVAQRTAREEFHQPLRWVDDKGVAVRDSASQVSMILARDKISRILLVAQAWKMPRAAAEFRSAGLDVMEAPVGFPDPAPLNIAACFPSSEGARWVRNVLRERLGMWRNFSN